MQPACIFVHGFNDRDAGSDNIDMLAPFAKAKGYKPLTQALDYGWRGLLGVRFKNREVAAKLVEICRPGDVVVGYSNGCDIIALAVEMGLECYHIIMIHPALDAMWCPPPEAKVRQVVVYYSPRDIATRAAGWLRKWSPFNWLFGKHRWGNMGTVGPMSDHPAMKGVMDGRNHFDWVNAPEKCLETLPDIG